MPNQAEQKKLAQIGDVMFERNLSHLASKGRELILSTAGGEEFVGFVAGLDDEYIQVCLTDDQSLALVNRSYLSTISESGRSLEDMLLMDVDGSIQTIHEKTRMFRSISEYYAQGKRK